MGTDGEDVKISFSKGVPVHAISISVCCSVSMCGRQVRARSVPDVVPCREHESPVIRVPDLHAQVRPRSAR